MAGGLLDSEGTTASGAAAAAVFEVNTTTSMAPDEASSTANLSHHHGRFMSTDLIRGSFAHTVRTRRASLGLSARHDLGLPELFCASGDLNEADVDFAAGVNIPLPLEARSRDRRLSLTSSSTTHGCSAGPGSHDHDGRASSQHQPPGTRLTPRLHPDARGRGCLASVPAGESLREQAAERERRIRLQGERELARRRARLP